MLRRTTQAEDTQIRGFYGQYSYAWILDRAVISARSSNSALELGNSHPILGLFLNIPWSGEDKHFRLGNRKCQYQIKYLSKPDSLPTYDVDEHMIYRLSDRETTRMMLNDLVYGQR